MGKSKFPVPVVSSGKTEQGMEFVEFDHRNYLSSNTESETTDKVKLIAWLNATELIKE